MTFPSAVIPAAGAPGFTADELRSLVKGDLGREAYFYSEVPSTNDLAMALAEEGAPHGLVVAADAQSGGRGRRGRRWASPPGGNIYISVVLRPGMPLRDAPLITLMAGVAAAAAMRRAAGEGILLKWPNDIVARGEAGDLKLGGMLLEARGEGGFVRHAVLGLGINVNVLPEGLPSEASAQYPGAATLRMAAGADLVKLADISVDISRVALMAAVLDGLSEALSDFMRLGPGPLIEAYRALSATLGHEVRVRAGSEEIRGRAMDIDAEGRLLVETGGGVLRRISAGDVEALRPA